MTRDSIPPVSECVSVNVCDLLFEIFSFSRCHVSSNSQQCRYSRYNPRDPVCVKREETWPVSVKGID